MASAIPPHNSDFLLESSLRESIDNELKYEAHDLGPIDRMAPDVLELEHRLFFGEPASLSPLTSACTSRSASPNLRTASRSADPSQSSCTISDAAPPTLTSKPKPAIASRIASGTAPSSEPLSTTSDTARKPQNSQSKRNKERGRLNRRRERKKKRADRQSDPYEVRSDIFERYILPADLTPTSFDACEFPTASMGFIALPDEGGGVHQLRELVEVMGFKVVEWDGRRPRPITDSASRIITVLAGMLENTPAWEAVHRGAAEAIRKCASKCSFPRKAAKHRRGDFPALSWGISHGGGQKEPGNLYHGARNARALSALATNENISRLAGNASGAFAAWAPKLYTYYEEHFDALLESDPTLQRNWPNSIWAAFAVNFGPRTICRRHRDFANLPFGWCGVTALGDFDPTKGGHLVLWSLKLVVEFPPGSTILLPSATIPHSNVPIGRRETRLSFTQYSAGGLFRWVDQGFQCTGDYKAKLTAEGMEDDLWREHERCKLGLSLFSTLDSLGPDQTARNRRI